MPDRTQTIAYPAPGSRPSRRDPEPLAPHVIVLFGATGDLSQRMLLPSLCALHADGLLDPALQITGTARSKLDDHTFRNFAREAVEKYIAAHERVFVIEQNRDGQLRTLLGAELDLDARKLRSVLFYGGFPLSAHHVVDGIKSQLTHQMGEAL